jgi:hypothetical protein
MCAGEPVEHNKEGKEQKPHGHAPKEVTTPLTNKVVDIVKMVCSVRKYTNVTQQGRTPVNIKRRNRIPAREKHGFGSLGFQAGKSSSGAQQEEQGWGAVKTLARPKEA